MVQLCLFFFLFKFFYCEFNLSAIKIQIVSFNKPPTKRTQIINLCLDLSGYPLLFLVGSSYPLLVYLNVYISKVMVTYIFMTQDLY